MNSGLAIFTLGDRPHSVRKVIIHSEDENDRRCHAAGDAVLARSGLQRSAHIRAFELAHRWGGRPFLTLDPTSLRLFSVDDAAPLQPGQTAATGCVRIP